MTIDGAGRDVTVSSLNIRFFLKLFFLLMQVEYERYSARTTFRGGRGAGLRTGRPPPGFERRSFDSVELLSEVSPASRRSGPTPIMVAYADGSNTLSLAAEPMVLHDITVSCVADTCHVFLSQMKNPTFAGLGPLEAAMFEAYNNEDEVAAAHTLLRPIATGSLLAVFSDEKWYRCQVVAYHPAADTCDIKFVDHGGYTTVGVSELRPLRSDFVRLPFQTIEVYVAAICAAQDEIMIDIAADLLFRKEVSVQLLGYAGDGVPVVQIYFYQADYIHLLSQEILQDCYQTYLRAHPNHVVVMPEKNAICLEDDEDEGSVCCSSSGETTLAGYESGIGTGSEGDEEEETVDWSQQVEHWSEADSTLTVDAAVNADTSEDFGDDYAPVYSAAQIFTAAEVVPQPAFYMPEPYVPVIYYVADPSGALYPVVAAAPIYQPAFIAAAAPVDGEFYPIATQYSEESHSHAEVEGLPYEYSHPEGEGAPHEYSHTEVEEEQDSHIGAVEPCTEDSSSCGVSAAGGEEEDEYERSMAELLSKPYEEWSQADYERFYEYEGQH